MKKLFPIAALCFLTITVKAQSNSGTFTMPPTLIMPDGSVVSIKKVDSIKKVFGGRDIIYSIQDDGTVHVHPANNKTEAIESETKLKSHLNKPAPEFAFKDLNGKLYSLPGLKGRIVVLNFWFTQCGGCIAEMPDLNELKRRYNGKDVVFLALTYDDKVKVNAFLTKHKFDYTIIPDAQKACLDYDIPDYPTSVLIDRSGVIRYIDNSINSKIKNELTTAIEDAEKSSYPSTK